MRRRYAVNLIKEIRSCRFLNPNAIFLEQTAKSGSYEIHIEVSIDDESWECLKMLSKKHGFGVKLSDRSLVIYKPLEKKYGKLIFA